MTTQRKRGRPPLKRLPMGSAGAAPRFEPDDALWAELAQIIGHDIDAAARAALTGIVQRYLDHVEFGTSAPKIDDAIRHLEALDGLLTALVMRRARSSASGLAITHAEGTLDSLLREAGHPPLRNLIERARVVARFTTNARAEISADNYPGFDRNSAWRSMVWGVRQFAVERGWRPTAYKIHVDTTGGGTRFVTFVERLQAAFPPEMQRFNTSITGLTEEIQKIIRAGKKASKSDPPSWEN